MNADFKNQKSILQEYINQFYVEHFENIEEDTNRAVALQTIDESRNWIYKGKLGYVVDSDGYVHYFLIIENLPKEIRDQIKYGKGEKKYSDYANCIDVWGITENLDVYYCKNGQNSMEGAILGNLSQENGTDEVFKAGSPLAKKIKGNDTDNVTKADLRGIRNFTLDKSTGLTNLNDMFNFSDLSELKIQDLNLTSLDGIEYLAKLERLYIIRSTVGNYKSLGKISEQIKYLFFDNTTNDEIEKFCSNDKGVGADSKGENGADFINLAYFGIYGKINWDVDYVWDSRTYVSGKTENCIHSSYSNVLALSSLSRKTKERITNLFLNNNSIDNIENLWEFKNVQRLRIEANYLKNLNGLYNKEANDGQGQCMTNLTYLHAYSNYLGVDEGDNLNIDTDGLNILSAVTFNDGSYKFEPRFKQLNHISLDSNKIKYLNYLYGYTSLRNLYLADNERIDLDFGVQSILSVLGSNNLSLECDTRVKDYVNNNSKTVLAINKTNVTMTRDSFISFFQDRENYLKTLTLDKIKILGDNGSELTKDSNPSFSDVIYTGLKDLTKIEGLYLKNMSNLIDINFVEKMNQLRQIDLRGSGVVNLKPLVTYCQTIRLSYNR